MIFDSQSSKDIIFNKLGLKNIMGMNKNQVVSKMGIHFNDINCDVWMYRTANLLEDDSNTYKYLYFFFKNNILMEVKFSRIRKKIIYKLIRPF